MKQLRIPTIIAILGAATLSACITLVDPISSYTDEHVTLTTQEGRDIPVRLLTPKGCEACPLIIFSHGANATYDRYDALLIPFAQAGYRVAAPNHTDSEAHPNREAYSPKDWIPTRLRDYTVIAADYETDILIAAGHSFGALIAQIAGGAQMPNTAKIDPQFSPKVVLAYSPPGPVPNYITPEVWTPVSVPTLVTTGTTDVVPMMAEQWELHLSSYEATPPPLAYALIYNNMNHYMNGAYGRETNIDTIEREKAVEHLVKSSLFFLSSFSKKEKMTALQWETKEQDFVEARAHHEQ